MRSLVVGLFLILVSALPALGSGNDGLTEIPQGQTLYAREESLAQLASRTSPTLVFTVRDFDGEGSETIFLWTAKAANGTRHFSLATVYSLKPPGGKLSYVIFNPGKPSFEVQPRVTTALGTTRDANDPQLTTGVQIQSLSAVVASIHPKSGTLYQLSLDRRGLDVFKHDERRIFIMHDPDHGWRYVGQLAGNRVTCTDSVDYTEHRHVETTIAWTGVPEAPVRIGCRVSADYELAGEGAVAIAGSYTISGTLPAKMRDSRFTLTVLKGQTFSGIAGSLAAWRGDNSSNGRPTAAELSRSLLVLNPGVDPNRLRAGDKLVVPDIYAHFPVSAPSAPKVSAAR